MDKLELLKKILKENKELDYWIIVSSHEHKHNLYVTKNAEKENYLSGDREDFFVTVYKKFGEYLGEASVSIIDFDENSIKQKISEALFAASLSLSPLWVPISNQPDCPKITMHDSAFDAEPKDIKQKIFSLFDNTFAEVKKNERVKFTSSEILTTDNEIIMALSNGTDLRRRRSVIYVELVLTAPGPNGEVEFLAEKTVTQFDKINVSEFVDEAVKTVTDIANAEKAENFSGPIILTGPAIKEFFVLSLGANPIINNASARAKFMKVSKFELGEKIADMAGDKLTMMSDPLIPHGLLSSQFDSTGIPARKLILVEDGVLKNWIASKQFADYLKIAPTGPLGNIVISTGQQSAEEFYKTKEPILEIASFSWFDPSPYAGDFASEVRLGYVIKDGKRMPFKGGMLIGSVFDAVADASYSKEIAEDAGYYGPTAAKFNKLKLSGL